MVMIVRSLDSSPSIFGVPLALELEQARRLINAIADVWEAVYGRPLGPLEDDIEICRSFFDPVARGHKLRERLGQMQPVPTSTASILRQYGEPLFVDVGGGSYLVGVEGRMLRNALEHAARDGGTAILTTGMAFRLQGEILEVYRRWSRHRLDQVIALREGRGSEVLQATSVGIVLTLLVNRSTSPTRAIGRFKQEYGDRVRVDHAIHSAAGAFADSISSSRRRLIAEQRLIGGHWLTEARRRLAHRLVLTEADKDGVSYLYVREDCRDEVISFLARDLARRPNVDVQSVADGFDSLVSKFRAAAVELAGQEMIFERPAETSRIKQRLLTNFSQAKEREQESC